MTLFITCVIFMSSSHFLSYSLVFLIYSVWTLRRSLLTISGFLLARSENSWNCKITAMKKCPSLSVSSVIYIPKYLPVCSSVCLWLTLSILLLIYLHTCKDTQTHSQIHTDIPFWRLDTLMWSLMPCCNFLMNVLYSS